MTSHHLYKAVWYWKDDHLAYQGQNEGKERIKQSRPTQDLSSDRSLHFLENVDQTLQKLYKQKYQRTVKPNVPNVVTIQDIKDVVTYLMIGKLPKSVMALFHSYEINPFFRALITYMQFYLQVWEDLSYRRTAYSHQRLKHPISSVRENLCHTHLSRLRSRIGQEYALIIAGEGTFKKNHHMNNTINRSYTSKDITLYEYIFKLTARVVWIALHRSNYREIEIELARLFHAANIFDNTRRLSSTSRSKAVVMTHQDDKKLLHGDHKASRAESNWHQRSPAISGIFINQDDPDLLLPKNVNSPGFEGTRFSGLEAAITLPEELLERFGVTVGILGLPRDNFEAMLHVKQEPPKSLEEEEIARAIASIVSQSEKPYVRMYEFLKQLDDTVDLMGADGDEKIIKEDIKVYLLNHIEDSKNSIQLWKYLKCF